MSLKICISCNQTNFGARRGGSCWGIAVLFCKNALESGAVAGTKALLKNFERAVLVEEIMKVQDDLYKVPNPLYSLDEEGEPISDLNSPAGFKNQNLAVQMRHDAMKELAEKNGMRCIGTLSSFFEGGKRQLMDHLIELSKSAGIAAVQVALQQPEGHAVALYWNKGQKVLYFFDPNSGLHRASDVKKASVDLENQFNGYNFAFGHVLLKGVVNKKP